MSGYRIEDPATALKFMLAGKAVVTLKSLKTGAHVTLKVKTPPADKTSSTGPSHFVAVRTGGAGEKNYAYLGFLKGGRQYLHGRKSKIVEQDDRVRAFRYALNRLLNNEMPPECEIWHEGTCGRCGRALTVPSSIASGIGPECATKMECV
jgi:hypothetical protein